MYQVSFHPQKGRSLVATRPIQEGETLFVSSLLIFNQKDTEKLAETILDDYVFSYDDERVCIPFGDAMLMNHSDKENIGWELLDKNNFRFYAVKDIPRGEELCINYGYDPTPFKEHQIYQQLSRVNTMKDLIVSATKRLELSGPKVKGGGLLPKYVNWFSQQEESFNESKNLFQSRLNFALIVTKLLGKLSRNKTYDVSGIKIVEIPNNTLVSIKFKVAKSTSDVILNKIISSLSDAYDLEAYDRSFVKTKQGMIAKGVNTDWVVSDINIIQSASGMNFEISIEGA